MLTPLSGPLRPDGHPSLSVADALKALREDIQAENTLIASRVTWYVTSQAFLLTAYATSWNANFVWPAFFHGVLPIAAIVLSALILASISAATWAQDVYVREQAILVARLRSESKLSESESMALDVYERTMVGNRRDASGRLIGGRIHALVRITPLILPVGFSLLWLYAYHFAPRVTG
jgi:tellurite resistance protein